MVKYILRLDYTLSKWFAGKRKNEKVIPGTAFLFLNKVVFVGLIIVGVIIRKVGDTNWVVAIGAIFTLVIMKGFQRRAESMIRRINMEVEYKSLNRNQIYQRRFMALLIFIICFYTMIVSLIMLFHKL